MKKINLIISALLVMSMSSCSFFTTSWGSGLKRDLSQTYGKMSSDDLAAMINDPAVMNDKDSGKKILEELGSRDNLSSLSNEKKNDVLNLMVNSSISADTISQAVSALSNKDNDQDMEKFADDIISSIDSADTRACEQILSGDISALDGSTASLAAICLFAQVAKQENLTVEAVKNQVAEMLKDGGTTTPESAVDNLPVTGKSKDTLTTAFKALNDLKALDAEIMPGVKISSMFPATT